MAEARDETTLDTILHLKRREPFSAFQVVMVSGDRYTIEDPDALAIARTQMHYYPSSGSGIHLRLDDVMAVEESPESPRQRPPRRKAR